MSLLTFGAGPPLEGHDRPERMAREEADTRSLSEQPMNLTLGEHVEHIAPGLLDEKGPPRWPPDAFALGASVLRASDAYTNATNAWPPCAAGRWTTLTRRTGKEWKRFAISGGKAPAMLARSWRTLLAHRNLAIESVREKKEVWGALLSLVAAADEACEGAGFEHPGELFHRRVHELMTRDPSTLADRIRNSRLLVLPKLRAPRSGITVRSLTHNLALTPAGEVRVGWNPWPVRSDRDASTLNLLLLPWPERVWPEQFSEAPRSRANLPDHFGFFRCAVRRGNPMGTRRVTSVLQRARREVGRIDGIVFPELALLPGEAEALCRETGIFVVGGEGDPEVRSGHNVARVAAPYGSDAFVSWSQPKHHRWRLDESQIATYGLVDQLAGEREWWEHFPIQRRELVFWRPQPGITACVLICEDLARPDPVAEIVRAVAPNLVISLLLDGPQLLTRWPARYATVLADDPGSSVLTLTCLGMAALSRPPERPVSRVIGLWKDPLTGPARELTLPEGHDALVLKLKSRQAGGWTADGRPGGEGLPFLTWSTCVAVPRGN